MTLTVQLHLSNTISWSLSSSECNLSLYGRFILSDTGHKYYLLTYCNEEAQNMNRNGGVLVFELLKTCFSLSESRYQDKVVY